MESVLKSTGEVVRAVGHTEEFWLKINKALVRLVLVGLARVASISLLRSSLVVVQVLV